MCVFLCICVCVCARYCVCFCGCVWVWSEQGEALDLNSLRFPTVFTLQLSGDLRLQRGRMDLSHALDWPAGGNNQSNQGGPWPGQPNNLNPVWSGAGGNPNPVWSGGNQPQPAWPGGNPSQPAWSPSGPQPCAPGGFPGPGPGPGPVPVPSMRAMVVPYNQDLPSGVYDKLLITIQGTVKPNADKFMVDLYTSSGDLAFHFNPRFNEGGKQVIVRNSCIGKKWGKEERELRCFPFVKGQPFEIKIMCTNTAFKVAVNNSHLLDYNHRIPNLRSITRFCIINDISLSNVLMETMS